MFEQAHEAALNREPEPVSERNRTRRDSRLSCVPFEPAARRPLDLRTPAPRLRSTVHPYGLPDAESSPAASAGVGDPDTRWIGRPLRWSLIYLSATFMIFFLTKAADGLPSSWPTVIVVGGGAGMLALGYRFRARRGRMPPPATPGSPPSGLIAISALWAIAYGTAYLAVFGASGWADLLSTIADPGQAYAAKFEVFEAQSAVSLPIQVVTLTAGLMTLLIPLLITWWRDLSLGLRVFGVMGVLAFLTPFAYIGTNQGFGYAAVLTLVGVSTGRAVGGANRKALSRKGRLWVAISLSAGLAFFLAGSIGRTDAFGLQREYNPRVAAVVGERIAAALESAVFYPTHGYRGLAETLTQPFVFSGGYGSSRALTRYAVQYFGLPDAFPLTYPVRTEYATGYPSGLVWHTIYPWLASDLTFPGAVLVMGLVGWALAAWWLRSVRQLDPLSIGLMGYAAIFVAFIPANNQIGLSQVNLIGFMTLLTLFAIRGFGENRARAYALKRPRLDDSPAKLREVARVVRKPASRIP